MSPNIHGIGVIRIDMPPYGSGRNVYDFREVKSVHMRVFTFLRVLFFLSLVFDIGTSPAYFPRPRGLLSLGNNHKAKVTDASCKAYGWNVLSEKDRSYHEMNGGLAADALERAKKRWKDVVFHFHYGGGKWKIYSTPAKCVKGGRVCWGRTLSVLETLVAVTDGIPPPYKSTLENVDVLYSPWDEPVNSSEYPVWQYNRHSNAHGVILPYNYAFDDERLRAYKEDIASVRRAQSEGYRGSFRLASKPQKPCHQRMPHTYQGKDDRAVFRGSATYASTFQASSRGRICGILETNVGLREKVDIAIVEGAPEGTYCDRSHKRISLAEQGNCYTMILDIEGQSFFTDRTPMVLLLNSTLVRQERGGVDFLTPFFLKPWKHYVPMDKTFKDIIGAVDWVRAHRRKAKVISDDATKLGSFLTTDQAMMCAYFSNLKMLRDLNKEPMVQALEDGVTLQPSFLFVNLLWERPGDGAWRLFINIPGNPFVAAFVFVLQKLYYFIFQRKDTLNGKLL